MKAIKTILTYELRCPKCKEPIAFSEHVLQWPAIAQPKEIECLTCKKTLICPKWYQKNGDETPYESTQEYFDKHIAGDR